MKAPETHLKHRTAIHNARIGYFVKRYPSGIHRVQLRRQGFNGQFRRLKFGHMNPHAATFRNSGDLGYTNKEEAKAYALLMNMKEREMTIRMLERVYSEGCRKYKALSTVIATSQL